MSSSSDLSDTGPQIVHVIQRPTLASSRRPDAKDMSLGLEAVTPLPFLQPHASAPSQHYTIEEQITTVHIPMRRPNEAFLEILHDGGACGTVFTMKEMVHHVKNYIIKHRLFDPIDPRVVHCRNNKLGNVLQVKKFTVNEAVPLFLKNSLTLPDSCIRIKRQLVKKAIDSSIAANSTSGSSQEGSSASSTVTSSTQSRVTPGGGSLEEGGSASACPQPPSSSPPLGAADPGLSLRLEYSDEVDGALVQVNVESRDTPAHPPHFQVPEKDSFSVLYDSDHFAVEYELEASDDRSESEHSSNERGDYLVVQKESDVEFWADYSDTESNSDSELVDGDQWACEMCGTRNVAFYRHCGHCWAVRRDWLPDSALPSSTSSLPPLPAEPRGLEHGYHAGESGEEAPGSQGSLQHWRLGHKVRPRRQRVMSASSSDRMSESLLSEEEGLGTASHHVQVNSATTTITTTIPSQETSLPPSNPAGASLPAGPSSAGLPASKPSSQATDTGEDLPSSQDRRERGGGRWGQREGGGRGRAEVVPASDVCMVCASRPKTGCIVHGSSGHQVCCYRCAKRLRRKGLPCPVCRRPIQKVIKNFVL